jgi:hypothetical protein
MGQRIARSKSTGRELFVRITLQGTWIWIFATGMDEGEPPQFLFNVGDGPAGWVTVRRFVAALERSGIKSLRQRPVELGTRVRLTHG